MGFGSASSNDVDARLMAAVALPFGALLPDQPAFSNPGLEIADGCIPAVKGYAPRKAFAQIDSVTAGSIVLSGGSFKAPNGTTWTFLGTATTLYTYNGAGLTAVGTGYTGSAERPWAFQIFGATVIATNGADAPQKFDLTNPAPRFIPLGGTPPRLGLLGVVRDFLVGGIVNGDAQTLQWSGINNSERWNPGVAQSDFQVFPVGGSITGVLGGEYGIILQESRISLMQYSGGNTIFQFDEISANIGCIAPRSVAQFGKYTFFLSERGFMMMEGAMPPVAIGDEKIDRTFLAGALRTGLPSMSCAVDPVQKVVVWTQPTSGTPSIWYQYNWLLDKWSTNSQGCETLWRGMTRDVTLDDADVYADNLDAIGSPTLDSSIYLGGDPGLFVVDNTHRLGSLTGANVAATFGFGDIELIPGRWSRIRAMRPDVDAASGLTLTINGRARLGDTVTPSNYTSLRASGDIPIRDHWRYVRPSLTIAAGTAWTNAQGMTATVEPGGRR